MRCARSHTSTESLSDGKSWARLWRATCPRRSRPSEIAPQIWSSIDRPWNLASVQIPGSADLSLKLCKPVMIWIYQTTAKSRPHSTTDQINPSSLYSNKIRGNVVDFNCYSSTKKQKIEITRYMKKWNPWLKKKKKEIVRAPEWLNRLNVRLLISMQIMKSGFWDRASHQALCKSWSLIQILSLPVSVPPLLPPQKKKNKETVKIQKLWRVRDFTKVYIKNTELSSGGKIDAICKKTANFSRYMNTRN